MMEAGVVRCQWGCPCKARHDVDLDVLQGKAGLWVPDEVTVGRGGADRFGEGMPSMPG